MGDLVVGGVGACVVGGVGANVNGLGVNGAVGELEGAREVGAKVVGANVGEEVGLGRKKTAHLSKADEH